MPAIRAIALDVDGVLTDGGVFWGPDGAEWKRFCFADIMGVSLARKAGLIVTLISGEDSPLVDRFADKLGLSDITKGCKDKAAAMRAFAERHELRLEEICFMGDDVNDLAAMELAGLSAVPADARPDVRLKAKLVTNAVGGNGAVRELVDLILSEKLPVRGGARALSYNPPVRTRALWGRLVGLPSGSDRLAIGQRSRLAAMWGRLLTCSRLAIGFSRGATPPRVGAPLLVGQPILAAAAFQAARFGSRTPRFLSQETRSKGSSSIHANARCFAVAREEPQECARHNSPEVIPW